jgi:RimJ/RimL family protein N-acetyltransferase
LNEKFYIETERTILRRLTIDDAEDFFALNQDPQVLKYTGDDPFLNIQAAKDFLSTYDHYEIYGVGRFAVIEKSSSKFIGWCGLKYSSSEAEYDIGYRFFREYWKQGFATETSKKCLDYGFKDLKILRIVGRAMIGNEASIRVLEKLGMTFNMRFEVEGQEWVVYELTYLE